LNGRYGTWQANAEGGYPFEWASGYAMEFGLIAVDRKTQERTLKPSARFLGEIARANRLTVPGS
jgi:beta-glucosidase/6-phospho-beta-glucosidase/beta-galactosidase